METTLATPFVQFILSKYLLISDNALGMWFSLRDDADPRGIQPLRDMSTYRHRDVRYGHYPQHSAAKGVPYHFITPGQRRNVTFFLSFFLSFFSIFSFFLSFFLSAFSFISIVISSVYATTT